LRWEGERGSDLPFDPVRVHGGGREDEDEPGALPDRLRAFPDEVVPHLRLLPIPADDEAALRDDLDAAAPDPAGVRRSQRQETDRHRYAERRHPHGPSSCKAVAISLPRPAPRGRPGDRLEARPCRVAGCGEDPSGEGRWVRLRRRRLSHEDHRRPARRACRPLSPARSRLALPALLEAPPGAGRRGGARPPPPWPCPGGGGAAVFPPGAAAPPPPRGPRRPSRGARPEPRDP